MRDHVAGPQRALFSQSRVDADGVPILIKCLQSLALE
jgi:hypothetical protein